MTRIVEWDAKLGQSVTVSFQCCERTSSNRYITQPAPPPTTTSRRISPNCDAGNAWSKMTDGRKQARESCAEEGTPKLLTAIRYSVFELIRPPSNEAGPFNGPLCMRRNAPYGSRFHQSFHIDKDHPLLASQTPRIDQINREANALSTGTTAGDPLNYDIGR